MKKVFSAAIAALMCSMTLMGTSAAPVSAAQVATSSISSTQQTASTLPVKITRATSYVNERMNFTLTGSVKFGEVNDKCSVFAYGQSKKLDVTGFQLMFYNFNTGFWERPKIGTMGTVANGYFKTANVSTKTMSIIGVNVCGCPLYKSRYYKIAVVPVNLKSNCMTYAASKYYSAPIYYDRFNNCIVSNI